MVVGILDTKYNELAHYQGTSSTTATLRLLEMQKIIY